MVETRLRPASDVLAEEFGDYARDFDGGCETVSKSGIVFVKEGGATLLRSKVVIPQDQSLIIDKVSKDVSLDHPLVPKISCLQFFSSFVYEYRTIGGDFSLLCVDDIQESENGRKFKIIGQIIDFTSHLSQNGMVSSLFTLSDLARFVVVDSDDNLVIFDTSFIDICSNKEEASHKNLMSCGCLTLEILGGEIKGDYLHFPIDFPSEWKSYITTCIAQDKTEASRFNSRFVPKVLNSFNIFDQYMNQGGDLRTLRSLIDEGSFDKSYLVISLIDIIESILFDLKKQEIVADHQLSSEALTIDTIAVDEDNKVHFINTGIWIEANDQRDRPFNIEYQILFRLGHLIHQIMSSKTTASIAEWFEDMQSSIDDSLPLYAKISLFYCWFLSEYYQKHFYQLDQINSQQREEFSKYIDESKVIKIDLLIQRVKETFNEKQEEISLGDYHLYYPFINPSFETKHNLVIQVLNMIEEIFNSSHLQCIRLKNDDIFIDNCFELIKINEKCFDSIIKEDDGEGETEQIRNKLAYFPEKDIGTIIYQLFTDSEVYSSKSAKHLPEYIRKLIKLCFAEYSAFYVPFKSFKNSFVKKRISKKQSAILYLMKHVLIIDDLKNYKKISHGSSGTIYDMKDGRALKLINQSVCGGDGFFDKLDPTAFVFFNKESITTELRIMIFLNSLNIYKLYGVVLYPQSGEIGFVMDYIPQFLDKVIRKNNLSKSQMLDYSIQISECMSKLHSFGIIHRDLNPANIGVNKDGRIVIIDFGVSTFSIDIVNGELVGTPLFMAPELIEGRKYTNKVDVFSFAVTMTNIFGLDLRNIRMKNQYELYRKIMSGWRIEIPPSTPKHVARLIRRCWDADPDRRPSFEEITDILKSSMFDSELQEEKYESIDWSKNEGICIKESRSYTYKIQKYEDEKRESIKSHLDSIFMSGNPHIRRLEDYIFGEESICLIYDDDNDIVSLSEFVDKSAESVRRKFIVNNIEYLMTTFDMLHSNGLVVNRMNSKTMRVTSRGFLCLFDISVPGITSDSTFEDLDFIDAPELRNAQEFTVSSNVYSFGAMIAYVLSGWDSFNEDGTINLRKVDKKYQSLVRLCKSENRPDFQHLYKFLFPTKYRSYSQCIDIMNTRLSIFQTIQFRVDDLKPIREIGIGQYSRVILAENKRTGSKIVVKECNSNSEKGLLSPIYQELAALNVLKHPNLIRILGTVTSPMSGVRILMEYADGGDLSSLIKSKSLSIRHFAKLLVDISCGMNFMHVRNVIHRDLKPENVLISHKRALVSDFNSAAFVSDRGMPLVFGIRGTECFMSPEMMNSLPCSFSTDVFSFGMIVCCYFIDDVRSLWEQILNHEEIDFSFIVDNNMRNLAQRCLEFDWSRRPTFEFIGRFLIKKFKLTKYKTEFLYPSRHDLSQVGSMRNQIIGGNRCVAGDYGRHLLLEGKIEEAKRVFEQGTEDGSCMNNYGMLLYLEGKRRESVEYFKKAGDLGDVFALMVLGIRSECPELFDEERDDSPSRFKRALGYYQRATSTADRLSHIENPKAKYLEGLLYESSKVSGISAEESLSISIECFKEAALEYDSDGLNKVGLLVESGIIVDEFERDSETYFRMSASQMNPSGMKNMSRILKSRDARASEYYDGLSRLFGGSDVSDFRRAGDVLCESWEVHGQLSELSRGFEVGSEIDDRRSLSHLRSQIVTGLGIRQNTRCSKHMNDELSFAFIKP